jgi:16S rRNA processing protein RimM
MATRLCLAVITGARGLKGEVRLKSFAQDADHLQSLGPLANEDDSRQFRLYAVKAAPQGVFVRIEGIEDRSAADALRGTRLFIERARLPALAEDEFYHADLLGLDVVDEQGVPLGRLAAIHNFGAGDVLEISRAGYPALMLAFTQSNVPHVDLKAGRITVAPPVDAPDLGSHREETS